MDCPPVPFDLADWRSVPVIEGRAANAADMESCIAVLSLDGEGTALSLVGLPALAEITGEDGSSQTVIIVQTETDASGLVQITGYIAPSGEVGVGLFEEFTILDQIQDTR